MSPVTLQEMLDPESGRIRVRLVDTKTEAYEVGRKYMIRLEPEDFEKSKIRALAAAAEMAPERFESRFRSVA